MGEDEPRDRAVGKVLGFQVADQLLGLALEPELEEDLGVVAVEIVVLAHPLGQRFPDPLVSLRPRAGGGSG